MADVEIGSAARAAETRVPLGLALVITFTILSSTSVALRLYTRKVILRLVAADDYAIIVAQILSLGMSATNIVCFTAAGVGRHAEFVADKAPTFVKCVLAAISIYNGTQIATKISLLLQYRRLFLGQAIQWTCKGGIIFLAAWGVVQQIYTPFACGLITLILPKQKACLRPDIPFKLNAVMNMVTDFFILLIPVKPVLQLQVNRVRKMYLLIVLCFGLVVCGISALRLNLLVRASHAGADVTWDMAVTAYLSTIETCLGIMCASIPTLRPLIKKIAPVLVGSSHKNTSGYGKDYGNSTRLNDLSSSKQKTAQGNGIYIQKEVEFQSTTELRVPSAKDPYSIPDRSSDEVSLNQIQPVAMAAIRDSPPRH